MEAYTNRYRADNYCSPGYPAAWVRQVEGFESSAREVMHTGPFVDPPILIFSRAPACAQETRSGLDSQEDLKKLSSRSRRIIARGSTHSIQIDRADLLNREVSDLMLQLRGDLPLSSDYGSTKVE
jgi:hypothetical protein